MERLRVIPFAIAAAVLAVPSRVLAAQSEQTPLNLGEEERALDSAAPGGGSIVRTLIGLAIVIGVIYGLYWILKQVKASKEGKASGLGLSSVATLPLGGGRTVHLVRAGNELLLVGVGDHGVTLLRRYTEDEARELGLLPPDHDDTPEAPPGGWIDDLRRRTVIR
jgi:flagellar protein FliO/FliZ